MLFISFSIPSRSIRCLIQVLEFSQVLPDASLHPADPDFMVLLQIASPRQLNVRSLLLFWVFLLVFVFHSPSSPLHPWLFVSYSLRSSYSERNIHSHTLLVERTVFSVTSVHFARSVNPPSSSKLQASTFNVLPPWTSCTALLPLPLCSDSPFSWTFNLFRHLPSFPSCTPYPTRSEERPTKSWQKTRTLGRILPTVNQIAKHMGIRSGRNLVHHPPSFSPQQECPSHWTHASFSDDCLYHLRRVWSTDLPFNDVPLWTSFLNIPPVPFVQLQPRSWTSLIPIPYPIPHTVQAILNRNTIDGTTMHWMAQPLKFRSRSVRGHHLPSFPLHMPFPITHAVQMTVNECTTKHEHARKSTRNDARCKKWKRKQDWIEKRTLEQIQGRWEIVWRQSDEDIHTRSWNALRVKGKQTLYRLWHLDLCSKRGSSRYVIGFDRSFRSYMCCLWSASGCWFPSSHKC